MKKLMAAAGAAVLAVCAQSAKAQETRDFCPDRPGLGRPPARSGAAASRWSSACIDWTQRPRGNAEETDEIADGRPAAALRAHRQPRGPARLDRLHPQPRLRPGTLVDDGRRRRRSCCVRCAPEPAQTRRARASRSRSCPMSALPTGSDGIGGGDWGGGPDRADEPGAARRLLAPASPPMADAAVDADGDGRHFAYRGVIGLGIPISNALGATAELSRRPGRGSRPATPARCSRASPPAGHRTTISSSTSAPMSASTTMPPTWSSTSASPRGFEGARGRH